MSNILQNYYPWMSMLKMCVYQVKITKSIVEAKMKKKVSNLESKLTTLRKELKQEQQDHPHITTSREDKIQKLIETQKLLWSWQCTIAKHEYNN